MERISPRPSPPRQRSSVSWMKRTSRRGIHRCPDAVHLLAGEHPPGDVAAGVDSLVVMGAKARQALRVAWVLAALVGCSGNPLKVGKGGGAGMGASGTAGSGGAGSGAAGRGSAPDCSTLDEAACGKRSDCEAALCPDCKGGQRFTGCVAKGSGGSCPPSCPADCQALDEATCKSRSDCTAGYCPDCKGGQTFAGCTGPEEGVTCVLGCPAPPACSTLDVATCGTRGDCHVGYCSNCGQTFNVCLGPNEAAACPLYACPPPASCAGVDILGCNARPWCTPVQCPDCMGGQVYAGCVGAGEGISCAACPALEPCAAVTTQVACDARTDCHSVFGKCSGCSCPTAGCGVGFIGCADGGTASCMGMTSCQSTPPDCTSTNTTTYVVSYANGCYEGCVRPSECDSAPCPFPVNIGCFSGALCASAQVQPVCVHGEWRCPVGASSAVHCPSPDGGVDAGGE